MGKTDERAGYPLRVPIEVIQDLEKLLDDPGLALLEGLAGSSRPTRSALVRLALRRGIASLKTSLRRIRSEEADQDG